MTIEEKIAKLKEKERELKKKQRELKKKAERESNEKFGKKYARYFDDEARRILDAMIDHVGKEMRLYDGHMTKITDDVVASAISRTLRQMRLQQMDFDPRG